MADVSTVQTANRATLNVALSVWNGKVCLVTAVALVIIARYNNWGLGTKLYSGAICVAVAYCLLEGRVSKLSDPQIIKVYFEITTSAGKKYGEQQQFDELRDLDHEVKKFVKQRQSQIKEGESISSAYGFSVSRENAQSTTYTTNYMQYTFSPQGVFIKSHVEPQYVSSCIQLEDLAHMMDLLLRDDSPEEFKTFGCELIEEGKEV